MPEADLYKGFGSQGFNSMIALWEMSVRVVESGEELTPDTFAAYVDATEGDHMFGSTPLSCATAPEPYVAVCNSINTVSQWDGTNLVPVRPEFSGAELVAAPNSDLGPERERAASRDLGADLSRETDAPDHGRRRRAGRIRSP